VPLITHRFGRPTTCISTNGFQQVEECIQCNRLDEMLIEPGLTRF
jgi:hypothetical protein